MTIKIIVYSFWRGKLGTFMGTTLKNTKIKIERKYRLLIKKTKNTLKNNNIPQYHKINKNTYIAKI